MPTTVDGFQVFGAIEEKWLSLGGPNGALGHPVTNETSTFDGAGRFQNFQGGIVSWNPRPEMGAHVVWGLIGERWLQIGREQFGYPLTDETPTPDGRGRFNHFRAFKPDGSLIGESSIYWHPDTGAHEVYGAIRDFWAQHGWERGTVGYPIGAERDRGDGAGREQQFQRGRIVWSPAAGAMFGLPALQLRPVGNPVTSVMIAGTGFTPNQTVRIGYGITYPDVGGTTPHQFGDDTLTSDAVGHFIDPVKVSGQIHAAQALATDIATGATATASI
jgi:uncharacterized protein with LGFP repeats